jgi:hypothetical protein
MPSASYGGRYESDNLSLRHRQPLDPSTPRIAEVAAARLSLQQRLNEAYLPLDSDAHTTAELAYAETAIAHARLAGIPAERIVNCWPLDRLLSWLSDPASERL